MSEFRLPDLGEGLQDAEIVAWHVAEGDHVVADQPLVSVETEKAVVEVPAPQSGIIAKLLGAVGERIKVGALLVIFAEGAHADTGTVVGTLAPSPPPQAPTPTPPVAPATRRDASPAVRALARERGIDLASLAGSGPGGTVTREDVMRAGAAKGAAGETLRGVRRAMALNMARAHAEVVPATLWDEADVEEWWMPDADVTLRLVLAMAAACAKVPALNVRYDGAAMTRLIAPRVELGIAVDTEDGLIVPVLRDIGTASPPELRRQIDALKEAARARTLALADLRDPTITLSNFGTLAGRQAALVILPPQVAIVGAGRIFVRAVPEAGRVAARHVLPLSLTFDHRVVTGGEAARFLAAMMEDLRRREPADPRGG